MKQLLILLIVFVGSFQLTFADEFNAVPPGGIEIPLRPKKPRPKDVSASNEICYYFNGTLMVEFEQPEGRATMTVTRMEDGVSQTAVFYTFTTFSYNIGTAPGSYVINVKTSQCEYEGFLTIE